MAFQVGETIRLNAVIIDESGDPVDPTTVNVSINLPGGIEAIVVTAMTNSAVGSYHYDYVVPNTLGVYNWQITAAGSTGRVTIAKSMFNIDSAI